jgi:hypothetical protein
VKDAPQDVLGRHEMKFGQQKYRYHVNSKELYKFYNNMLSSLKNATLQKIINSTQSGSSFAPHNLNISDHSHIQGFYQKKKDSNETYRYVYDLLVYQMSFE